MPKILTKIYVKDSFTQEVKVFESMTETYEFMVGELGYSFDINLIYKNKSRKMRVCRRFYVSDENNFDFDLKVAKTQKKGLKNHRNDRLSQNWFKNKTRIIKSTKNL